MVSVQFINKSFELSSSVPGLAMVSFFSKADQSGLESVNDIKKVGQPVILDKSITVESISSNGDEDPLSVDHDGYTSVFVKPASTLTVVTGTGDVIMLTASKRGVLKASHEQVENESPSPR